MGFNVKGANVALEFAEGTLLAGARVECSLDMSVRDFVQMQRSWAQVSEGDMAQIEEAFSMFGDLALRDWDLEIDGEAIPATGEGLVKIPIAAANAIFNAWSDTVSARNPKPSAASASGRTSPAASEPTEQ